MMTGLWQALWHALFGHPFGPLRGKKGGYAPYDDDSYVRYCSCGLREILPIAGGHEDRTGLTTKRERP